MNIIKLDMAEATNKAIKEREALEQIQHEKEEAERKAEALKLKALKEEYAKRRRVAQVFMFIGFAFMCIALMIGAEIENDSDPLFALGFSVILGALGFGIYLGGVAFGDVKI